MISGLVPVSASDGEEDAPRQEQEQGGHGNLAGLAAEASGAGESSPLTSITVTSGEPGRDTPPSATYSGGGEPRDFSAPGSPLVGRSPPRGRLHSPSPASNHGLKEGGGGGGGGGQQEPAQSQLDDAPRSTTPPPVSERASARFPVSYTRGHLVSD